MTGRNIVSVRLLPRGGDGDFFGPRAGNSWFSQGLIKPGQPIAAVNLPGEQWSYLPDVARTMVALLARRDSLER
jgi:hypothetical protein